MTSPVVVDGRLTREKLDELLAFGAEHSELDFKATLDMWADRLAGCGVTQVFDLHTNQRGVSPGPDPRMIYIDGALFSDAIPLGNGNFQDSASG